MKEQTFCLIQQAMGSDTVTITLEEADPLFDKLKAAGWTGTHDPRTLSGVAGTAVWTFVLPDMALSVPPIETTRGVWSMQRNRSGERFNVSLDRCHFHTDDIEVETPEEVGIIHGEWGV